MTATPPTLLTSRLILRPLQDSDAERVARLAGEPEVALVTARIPLPYATDDALDFIHAQRRSQLDGSELIYAICLRDTRELIGCVGATRQSDGPHAELGYWLGQSYWGQGYASEAGRAMVDYLFQSQRLLQLNAHHLLSNPASGRVLNKLGFSLAGFAQTSFRDLGARDVVHYRLQYANWVAHPDEEGFA